MRRLGRSFACTCRTVSDIFGKDCCISQARVCYPTVRTSVGVVDRGEASTLEDMATRVADHAQTWYVSAHRMIQCSVLFSWTRLVLSTGGGAMYLTSSTVTIGGIIDLESNTAPSGGESPSWKFSAIRSTVCPTAITGRSSSTNTRGQDDSLIVVC